MSKDFKGIEGVEAVSSDKHLANFSDEKNCKSGEYNTSILGGSFNLVNTIIGSGIIGLPFAISSCGFGLGIFLLTFVAWLIYWSCVLLVKCGLKTGHLDFEELAEHSFGLLGYILVSLFMLIFCFGAMVAYFVVIGDSIPPVVQLYHPDLEITSRPILIVLFGVILVLPLCLLKDLTSLAKTSAVSITCDILIIFIVLIVGPGQAKDQGIVLTQQSLGGVGSTVFSGGIILCT
jgi:sodium-coupled neutral amino acid transporter 11